MQRFLTTVAEKVKQFTRSLVARRPANRANYRARPGVEALEDRQLLSGSPLSPEAATLLLPPTGVTTYHGVSAHFLNDRVAQDNTRIIDIAVDKASPLKFSASLVKNTGDNAQTWWWFSSLNKAQLKAQLSMHHA